MIRSDALPTELRGTFLHVKLQISSLETYALFHRTKIISFVIGLQLTQSVRKNLFPLRFAVFINDFLSSFNYNKGIFCSDVSPQFDVLSKTKI